MAAVFLCMHLYLMLQKYSEFAKSFESSQASHDMLIRSLQQQQDRLKICFEDCTRSITNINPSITSQCEAISSVCSASIAAVKRGVKDLETGTQRQVDALTTAVQAIAGMKCTCNALLYLCDYFTA